MRSRILRFIRKPIVIILVLLAAGVFSGLHWLQSWSAAPNSAEIKLTAPVAETQKTTTYQTVGADSKMFRSEVPADWTVRTNTSTLSLMQIVSFAKSGAVGQAGFTASTLPSGGLTAVDSYLMRSKDTATFLPAATDGFKGAAAVFKTKDASPAYTLYLVHGSRYASVTVTDMPNDSSSRGLLQHICETWQWL